MEVSGPVAWRRCGRAQAGQDLGRDAGEVDQRQIGSRVGGTSSVEHDPLPRLPARPRPVLPRGSHRDIRAEPAWQRWLAFGE